MGPCIRTSTDADRVMTLWLDVPDKPVNTCTPALLKQLGEIVSAIERENPAGVIITSAKPRSFNAGADLFEIRRMDRGQVSQYLAEGQALFTRIAKLPMPTVAAINGDCLGGGFELALACTHRVAADNAVISIGLPEVKLGLVPAWGGTTRLPRLIGLMRALPLLLAGKTFPPRKAKNNGLVDEVVRPEAILAAARRLVLSGRSRRQPRATERAAAKLGLLRSRILAAAEAKTLAQTHGNYPAPMKLIDVIRTGYEKGTEAGLAAERQALLDLTETDATRNLLRLFFLRQGAKRAVAEKLGTKPAEVEIAAVLGGGTMGAGIVHGLVKAGIQVRLVEVDAPSASAALARIRKLLDDDVTAGRLSPLDARHAMNRVAPAIDWSGLGMADLIIEAVVEQMDVKRDVFARLDRVARPDAVLASNTSSLSIAGMAAATSRPQRVVGLHFFNPVPKMPLVEVIGATSSSPAALATAAAVGVRMGKTPVLVNDSPGFLVNRVLVPYLAEATRAAAAGIPIERIDEALKDWGMPMGPFELLDEIGLDIARHVLVSLAPFTGGVAATPTVLDRMIERGWLGKKSGAGFYVYAPPKKGRPAVSLLNKEIDALLAGGTGGPVMPEGAVETKDLQDRLILPMLNEAARVLEEGVTDSTDAIDLATVLGLGLAPFRGGLLRFADSVGADHVVARLNELALRHGPRFSPATLLLELARTRGSFEHFVPEFRRPAPARVPQPA